MMPSAIKSVSVVIPLYNHEKYIETAIESVLSQTFAPKEIIVVDDGSTDRSVEVVKKIAKKEPRIIMWSHPNQDAPHTINSGIHRATGDLVAILNSDDIYLPDRLEICIEEFRGRKNIDAVFTGILFIDKNGDRIKSEWYSQAKEFYKATKNLSLSLLNGNFLMTTSNLVIRREIFHEIGYFSRLRYAHDLEFFLRLIQKGKGVSILDRELVKYRMHETNTINERHHSVRIEWSAIAAWFCFYALQSGPIDWSHYKDLLGVAKRHSLLSNIFYFLNYYHNHHEARCDSFLDDPQFYPFLKAHAE